MALPLLPILLIGGVAVVVVASQGKKKGKRSRSGPPKSSDGSCPPNITLDDNRHISKAVDDARRMYRSNPDPAVEANYIMDRALPKECTKADASSVFAFNLPMQISADQSVDLKMKLTVPQFYMVIAIGVVANMRLAEKTMSEAQYIDFLNRESAWYEGVTGKPFSMEELAAIMDSAMEKAMAK